jgi:hypothetical protein
VTLYFMLIGLENALDRTGVKGIITNDAPGTIVFHRHHFMIMALMNLGSNHILVI